VAVSTAGAKAAGASAADEVIETGAVTGEDVAACRPFIDQTAPENAASATTSNPADWTRIVGPRLDLIDLFSGLRAHGLRLIAA
jgi:hypothetical protein